MWRVAPTERIVPAPDEVVVWRIALDDVEDADVALLSDDEIKRADQFQFAEIRRAFIQGRLFLRRVVAQTLGDDPAALRFTTEHNGKPMVAGRNLSFNLSHSAREALLAIAGTGPVGVDLESVQADRDLLGLARRFFAVSEYQELLALSPLDQIQGFYRCWTRKEAFIKALGEGLSHPLDSFEVTLKNDVPAGFRSMLGEPNPAERWRIFDLELGPGMAGAVVVPATVQRLTCFTLQSA